MRPVITIGSSAASKGFSKWAGANRSRSTPFVRPRILEALSGAMCRKVSASKSEASNVQPNALAARHSRASSLRPSRAYSHCVTPRDPAAYCLHLSESISTMSKRTRSVAIDPLLQASASKTGRRERFSRGEPDQAAPGFGRRAERLEIAIAPGQLSDLVEILPVFRIINKAGHMNRATAREMAKQRIGPDLVALVGRIGQAMAQKQA